MTEWRLCWIGGESLVVSLGYVCGDIAIESAVAALERWLVVDVGRGVTYGWCIGAWT